MKTRIITALVSLLVLAGVLYFFNTPFFNFAALAVLLIAVHELTLAFKIENPAVIVFGFAPPFAVGMFYPYLVRVNFLWLGIFYVALFLAVLMVFFYPHYNFANLAAVMIFSAFLFAAFYAIIWFKILYPHRIYPYHSMAYTLLAMGAAWGGDTFAYFTGSAFGKHKLSPVLSPKKSVEGAIGALFGSVLANLAILYSFSSFTELTLKTGSYLIVVPVAIMGSLLGIMGDLLASAVKRQCEIKDYGYIFPGHGGVLDRFDSLILVLPFYAAVATFVPFILR